jgi:LPXTG-site transpeptidase (sortase) family protein
MKFQYKNKIVWLILLLFLIFISIHVAADTFTETQITFNTNNHYTPKPRISGDYLVWQGYDGDPEIFLYQISTKTTTQITNNTVNDLSPEIYGDYIVWQSFFSGDGEIMLYQISTATTTRLTNIYQSDSYPKIYANHIVWYRTPYGSKESHIMDYQIDTGITIEIPDSAYGRYPETDGNYIVWYTNASSSTREIFYYDIASQLTTQITFNTTSDIQPRISAGNITWQGNDGDDEIYLYQISTNTLTQLTSNARSDQYPEIYGNNIVWRSNLTRYYNIYLYNILTGITLNLSNNTAYNAVPQLDAHSVVWQSNINGTNDIYHYDIDTQTVTQITTDPDTDEYAYVSGDTIAWYRSISNSREIFIGQFAPPPTPTPPPTFTPTPTLTPTPTPTPAPKTISASGGPFTLPQTGGTFSLPNSGFAPNQITTLSNQPANLAYTTSNIILTIPQLNLSRPIYGIPQTNDSWDVSWLGANIGYLIGSAYPTTAGNTLLTAHVWDAANLPGPFAELKTLTYGDQYTLTINNHIYTYAVRENTTLPATADLFSLVKTDGYDWLTLITCENYDSASQTYTTRRIVQAILIEIE